MKLNFSLLTIALLVVMQLFAGNPIVKKIGLTDPHIVIFGDSAYVYATHDSSANSKGYVMNDWWTWSSADLIHWKKVGTLKPENTYIKNPKFHDCWAGFCVTKNSKYYWYLSIGPNNIGVEVANSPYGPWSDPLGKALIPAGMVKTATRDPDILMDDDGKAYIVFGTFDYFIVRLNDDMISLSEQPQLILDRKFGPSGIAKTSDKPSLHKRNGIYYLSWQSFYATASSPYGSYTYKGSVIVPENVAPDFAPKNVALWSDRHGNFFKWHNQWFYTYNDYSQPGTNSYYRDANISYVHYRDNGDMAPIRIDSIGVGQYYVSEKPIEAEDYFAAEGVEIKETPTKTGFEVRCLKNGCSMSYPNIMNLPQNATISFIASSANKKGATIEIRENKIDGKLLGKCNIKSTGAWDKYQTISCKMKNDVGKKNLMVIVKGNRGELARIDNIKINY
jgi:arabinoxylan arabinofuranohydrolase